MPPAARLRPTVAAILRYPVKGLSPEALDEVTLKEGETLPYDRAYAIENGRGRFDPAAPRHLPKINFLMLMRDERLARLRTAFDPDTSVLTVLRDDRMVARGNLETVPGRAIIEQFLAAYMAQDLRGPPKIVAAPGHCFSDVAMKCVHIVTEASLRELERAAGRPVDARRFRPNIVLAGTAPWAERAWNGRTLEVGGVSLTVRKQTERCAATNVDPATGDRNMDIPALLARGWGHTEFGVYASVARGGRLAVGETVTLV